MPPIQVEVPAPGESSLKGRTNVGPVKVKGWLVTEIPICGSVMVISDPLT